ncbi:response regulator transcription factor [Nitriliruptor alkaliphilus]|uniref:response regulator transcription factor n=1 Tax=Nitriliruptor alkaliphilus TaxID=427918 RepID=UPI0006983E76|nr:response regulator [Nitriliruptor alkaliphilus]
MVRVLAVDDDPVILRLLQLNLELEGHEVLTAADGRSGLEAIRREHPEVVLLDVMMPNLDGFQVCNEIRADPDPQVAATPIIFLSAKAQELDITTGMAAGADAYVTKPFDPLELVELVDRLGRGG